MATWGIAPDEFFAMPDWEQTFWLTRLKKRNEPRAQSHPHFR